MRKRTPEVSTPAAASTPAAGTPAPARRARVARSTPPAGSAPAVGGTPPATTAPAGGAPSADSALSATPNPKYTASFEDLQDRNGAFKTYQTFKAKQGRKKVGTAAFGAVVATAFTGLTANTTAPATTAFPVYIENGQCSLAGGETPGGVALTGDKAAPNELKNRYVAPNEDEIDHSVNEKMFTSEGPPDATGKSVNLDESKGAYIKGYVFRIVPGGAETCNCKTPDQQWHDTHIYLSPDGTAKKLSDCFVVEVTPRFRLAGLGGNISKSTSDLVAAFPQGTQIQVTGWQFYDKEHEPEAFAINPKNPKDWRATCWEIHPVTDITLVGAAPSVTPPKGGAATTKKRQRRALLRNLDLYC